MAEITFPTERRAIEVGGIVMVIKRFRVFRDFGNEIDVCDEDGNCFKVSKKIAFPEDYKNEQFMKAMKDATLTVATHLATANNTVTTLEVKNDLRRDYPYYFWTQDVVSKYMDQLAGDGIFTYTDNGTYRIYSLVNAVKTVATKPTTALTKTVKASSGTISVTNTTNPAVNKAIKKITWAQALNYATNSQFAAVTLKNGETRTASDIKRQKKSPLGYISPKQGRVDSILVGTTLYTVK